jgi:protein gp37
MSAVTSIAWTDRTWNPVRGCSRVSSGCTRCYAETVAARFSGPGLAYEGLARWHVRGGPIAAEDTKLWAPGEREARWTGKIRLVPEALDEPLRWRKPQRIFVNSMSDLFHEEVPDEFIDRVFAVMAIAPRHTFQVLTKRPERMRAYLAGRGRHEGIARAAFDLVQAGRVRGWDWKSFRGGAEMPWPLPNVHLGVSVEDQAAADERIPLLLKTPAVVRFISAEPLLGRVDLHSIELPSEYNITVTTPGRISALTRDHEDRFYSAPAALDWVIVGGESGPKARPTDVAWIRSIVEQCRAASVPCFVKQDSGPRPGNRGRLPDDVWAMKELPRAS